MNIQIMVTWLRARAALARPSEGGFATAENIGYAVMAIVAASAIFLLISTEAPNAIWGWIQTNIFSKETQ